LNQTNTRQLPDSVHDTGSNSETGKVSHATGKSIVPQVSHTSVPPYNCMVYWLHHQALQEGLPEKVEKIVPNAIHDTKGAKFSDGSVDRK
jgi:hypothetical protein